MQQNVSSDFWTWVVAALLCFYLAILLRSVFIFFFMGGRKKLLAQEKALLKTQGDKENGDNAVKTAGSSSHKTVQFLA